MVSISLLTVCGDDSKSDVDLATTVEEATRFFPTQVWDEVEYLGRLMIKHDLKVQTREKELGAFAFNDLLLKVRKIRAGDSSRNLLLGVTHDPIVAVWHFFSGKSFGRSVYLIHDFVDKKVGVISFFKVKNETSPMMVAHGLGHSKGLRHHNNPVDLMHPDLLRASELDIEGFCRRCFTQLVND